MNLRQLRYFLRIAETGNMTRAAETLNVAQTALGIQIRNLEAELDLTLIERHSRGIRLTPTGTLFRDRLREVLAQLDAAVAEARAFHGGDHPAVYVGLTPSVMALIGPAALELARTLAANVSVRFVEALSFNLMAALEREELQVALAFNVPERPGLSRRALLDETLFLVTAARRGNNGVPVRFTEVLKTELALLSRQDIIWCIVHEVASYLSLPVEVAFEVQSTSAIKALVERDVATTVMPWGLVAAEVEAGTFCARPIDDARVVRTLFLIRNHGPGTDAAAAEVDRVMDAIARHYAEALGPNRRLLPGAG